MISKTIRAPEIVCRMPNIRSEGVTIVKGCSQYTAETGSMFLKDHLLVFILKGSYVVRFREQVHSLGKNQMILLPKAIVVEYEKTGGPEYDYLFEGMMFFLKDDFLIEFIKKVDISVQNSIESSHVSVRDINPRLIGFIQSLMPYFDENESIDAELIKLKMVELLYGIAQIDQQLLLPLIQFKQQVHRDISQVLEANYMNPVSISDLAYLSHRSLSSFKRDFQTMYNIPPSQWLKKRRLKKAKELLINTEMSVTDICYTTGFENLSHFSKVYRSYYNHSPSSQRSNLS